MEILEFRDLKRQRQIEIMGEYLDYMELHRKRNFSNIKPAEFEDYLYNNYIKCKQCGEWKNEDDMGDSELALEDVVCKECMENSYGK